MKKLWLGAVAYDPKVVTIWEGMSAYFRDEAQLDIEILLYLRYEAQVEALLANRIDIAWNTNLAYLQAEAWSERQCKPLGMRDTDRGWKSLLLVPAGGSVERVADVRGRTIALGSKDSGHAAILPVHFLAEQGLTEGKDYRTKRIDSDVGKHGDTGTSELEVLRAVAAGEVDAGMVGSPFWANVLDKKLVPEGAVKVAWESAPFSHCMFTACAGLDEERAAAFREALFNMSWDNPAHRPILEAEGLKRWLPPTDEGYASLRSAASEQGFFRRVQK